MIKYRSVKELCLRDLFHTLRRYVILAYMGWTLTGRNSVRDLINAVVYYYSHSGTRRHRRLRRIVKRYLTKKLRKAKISTKTKLVKFGFPIPY